MPVVIERPRVVVSATVPTAIVPMATHAVAWTAAVAVRPVTGQSTAVRPRAAASHPAHAVMTGPRQRAAIGERAAVTTAVTQLTEVPRPVGATTAAASPRAGRLAAPGPATVAAAATASGTSR